LAAQSISSIRYRIETSLNKSGHEIVEHTQILFHVDSSICGPLRFWRLQLDHSDDFAAIDSIKVNDVSYQIPANLSFAVVSTENYPQKADDLLFILPCAELLIAESINSIDFYYCLHMLKKSLNESPVPDGFVYTEYYPRLAFSPDSLLRPKQRAEAYHEYSLKITIPSDLILLSEKQPNDSIYDDGLTTFAIGGLNACQIIWMAAPGILCRRTILANDVETFIFAKSPGDINNAIISQIDSSLRFYESAFGALAFERLNLLFVDGLPPELGGGAVLNFMIFPAQENKGGMAEYLLGPLENIYGMAPSHETAHLWWGSGVYFSDDWPAEALATYWSQEYRASRDNEQKDNIPLLEFTLYRLDVAYSGNGARESSEYTINYFESPRILRMLSNDMGKKRFTNLCRAFYDAHRYSINNADTLRRFLSDSSNKKADEYFSLWTDSGYTQNYAIAEIKSEKGSGQYNNRLRLSRTGKAYSSVIVRCLYANGSAEDRRFYPDDLCAEWTTSSALKSAMIDPDCEILESARSDNGWPIRPRIHVPSINPAASYMNYVKYLLTDEPAYHIWLSPLFPSHSDQFGWTISAFISGKRSTWFWDRERGNHMSEARIGYNDRTDGVIYSAQYTNGFARHNKWGVYYKIGSERIEGHSDAKATLVYNRWVDSFGSNWLVLSISGGRRNYYKLYNIETKYWPERKTFPITLNAAFLGHNGSCPALQNFDLRLFMEKGIGPTSSYDQYSKMSGQVDIKVGIIDNVRLFIGELSGKASQEKFGLATDGMVKSCPPFIYRTKRMAGIRLFMDASLNSFIAARFFATGVGIRESDKPFAECGVGMLLGTNNLGLILDTPLYVNRTDFDGKYWNFGRIRLQLLLFNNEKSPQLDFRIK
jgi:hypothetical protein